MKKIEYRFLSCEVEHGTKDPKQIFLKKEIYCQTDASYENNLCIAQQEAFNGEYTVEDVDDNAEAAGLWGT